MNKLSAPISNNNFELIKPNQYINPQLSSNSNSNIDYKALYQNLISNLYPNINLVLPNSVQNPPSMNNLVRSSNLQYHKILNDQVQVPFTVVFQPTNTGAPTPMLPPPSLATTAPHPQPPPLLTAITPLPLQPPSTIALPPPTPIPTLPPIFTTPKPTTETHDNSSTLSTNTRDKSSTEMSSRTSTNSGTLTKTSSRSTLRNTRTSQAIQVSKFKLSMGLITFVLVQFVI